MGAPHSVPVADIAPGESGNVSVEMVAPTEPGIYRGDWRLQLADGTWLGDPIWVVILVASPDPIPAGQEGVSVTIEGKTWTLPCGSPIPPGAVCVCDCVTVPLPGDVGEVPPGDTGINFAGPGGETRTMPCGSPIPPGWTCTCNCVSVPPACSCVGHCSCDSQGIHYWYPC